MRTFLGGSGSALLAVSALARGLKRFALFTVIHLLKLIVIGYNDVFIYLGERLPGILDRVLI